MTMINFTIDENYVITAIDIDGVVYNCSLQIDADWVPYLRSNMINSVGTITGVVVGDADNDSRFVSDGGIVTDTPGERPPMEPIPVETYTVSIYYDGIKYTHIKCWSGSIWFTDPTIGNPLWNDGGQYLRYTVGYAPVSLQFVKVENGVVTESSTTYEAEHSGSWLIHDDGSWERYEPVEIVPPSKDPLIEDKPEGKE